ncbi:hypothetical protein HK097_000873 [Rhizophlyctis rosea]|uniref:Ferritin n=1 Tax=Rhizophlyctis rosea TaxID=64517 RepID=A0AAD5X151_9FUNG|nr:hypothetical protein HK097_000873 [Rhizophlyctis rosea]
MAMRLSERMLKGLVTQANREFANSNLYLSMSLWFQDREFPGSAQWCRTHSEEERRHGLMIFDHIVKRRAKGALVQAIPTQPFNFHAPSDIWKSALEEEQKNSIAILDLVAQAREENDFTTDNFLQWFVKEQLEEESAVDDILTNAKEIEKTKGLYREYDSKVVYKEH